ncbi:hypothetical protein AURDEDRAFT_170752 [Auricularia subglabra TFB-10046 SS5]|uniref:F-box domain-containing protein n=1 Tax=Auricularia subglabra (strain TFB-10046 / SS5) TaxID=717982 RepID=J0LJG2_AURST|nr:hypothetical protein AURDEDRAFT_170752 [Auricularia subglabra TFB-10046 SS5]
MASDTSQLPTQIRMLLCELVDAAFDTFLKRLLNRPAISVLPAELLCQIFSLLHFRDKIATSHVCKDWRAISLAAPSMLWSKIVARDFPLGSLRERLHRARTVPVQLDVTAGPTRVDELVECLHAHMSHIRFLNLGIGDDSDTTGELSVPQNEALSRALKCPAPMLTAFLFFNPVTAFIPTLGGPGIFSGHAPLLELVKYQGDELPTLFRYPAAFTSVRRILLSTSRWTLFSELSAVLPALPNLMELGIDVDEFDLFDEDLAMTFPLSLSRFVLISNTGSDDFDPTQIVRYVSQHAPQVTDVYISFEIITPLTPDYARELVTDAQHAFGPITSLAVLPSGSPEDFTSSVDLHLKTAAGHQRTVFHVPLPLFGWPDVFSNVVRLSVSENCWAPVISTVTAPMPCLQELEVWLDLQAVHPTFESVFVVPTSASGRHRTLSCPSLRVLQISSAPGLQISEVPPEVISDFIRFRLEFAEDRIERLLLRGPGLHESNPTEVARLLTLVDCVIVGDGVVPFVDPDRRDDLLCWD